MSRKKPWVDRDASTQKAIKDLAIHGVDHKAELNSRLRLLISHGGSSRLAPGNR
ncbi:hypothetical protein [Hyalangium versicolor]|uniref:hypothetical protein n=1 Tax=Hyalangium versicolor TaxID=2861190 RepID=UPI001CCC472D|nr:hypothetical protein [Hyalangium versicolor]